MTSLKWLIKVILASQIEIARKRLYANDTKFNNFENIDNAELKRIKELAKQTDTTLFSYLPHHPYLSQKFEKYLAVLQYLGSTNTNNDLPNYDAKIVFLIEAVDPNLTLYKAYLEYPVILKSQIAAEENLAKKFELEHLFKRQNGAIESKIRSKAEFYDVQMLNYEAKYFKKIRCHDELLTNVNHAYFNIFAKRFENSNKFSGISQETNDILCLKAEEYLGQCEVNLNTLSYQLLFQPEILGLNSLDEIIIFFILVIDKDLKLLDIYNEEAKWTEIKKRALREMSFYNPKLLYLEKIYQERFVPDYIPWEKREVKKYD